MEGLNRITFFKSYWDAEQQMHSHKDRLSFFEAICTYAFEEKYPEMTPAAAAAFTLVQPYLDKSIRKALNGKNGGSKQKANGPKCESKPEANEPKSESKPEANEPKPESNKKEEEEERRKKEEKTKHKYGEYGWVLLSDEQHQKLLNDLGEAELKRCIRIVDEAAQKTGNRCGWKDWNLTLRNCHRDGWGLKAGRESAYGSDRLSGSAQKQEQDWNIQYD